MYETDRCNYRFSVIGTLCLLALAACGAGSPQKSMSDDRDAPINVQQINAKAAAIRKENGIVELPAKLSSRDLLRVCKAGASFRNGRDVRAIKAKATNDQQVRLSYIRDDGKFFRYDCLVMGNVLRFRMLDEAGLGTGPGAWSGKGSTTTFKLNTESVEVMDEFFDGSSDKGTIKI